MSTADLWRSFADALVALHFDDGINDIWETMVNHEVESYAHVQVCRWEYLLTVVLASIRSRNRVLLYKYAPFYH
jgi:hypothetical protein